MNKKIFKIAIGVGSIALAATAASTAFLTSCAADTVNNGSTNNGGGAVQNSPYTESEIQTALNSIDINEDELFTEEAIRNSSINPHLWIQEAKEQKLSLDKYISTKNDAGVKLLGYGEFVYDWSSAEVRETVEGNGVTSVWVKATYHVRINGKDTTLIPNNTSSVAKGYLIIDKGFIDWNILKQLEEYKKELGKFFIKNDPNILKNYEVSTLTPTLLWNGIVGTSPLAGNTNKTNLSINQLPTSWQTALNLVVQNLMEANPNVKPLNSTINNSDLLFKQITNGILNPLVALKEGETSILSPEQINVSIFKDESSDKQGVVHFNLSYELTEFDGKKLETPYTASVTTTLGGFITINDTNDAWNKLGSSINVNKEYLTANNISNRLPSDFLYKTFDGTNGTENNEIKLNTPNNLSNLFNISSGSDLSFDPVTGNLSIGYSTDSSNLAVATPIIKDDGIANTRHSGPIYFNDELGSMWVPVKYNVKKESGAVFEVVRYFQITGFASLSQIRQSVNKLTLNDKVSSALFGQITSNKLLTSSYGSNTVDYATGEITFPTIVSFEELKSNPLFNILSYPDVTEGKKMFDLITFDNVNKSTLRLSSEDNKLAIYNLNLKPKTYGPGQYNPIGNFNLSKTFNPTLGGYSLSDVQQILNDITLNSAKFDEFLKQTSADTYNGWNVKTFNESFVNNYLTSTSDIQKFLNNLNAFIGTLVFSSPSFSDFVNAYPLKSVSGAASYVDQNFFGLSSFPSDLAGHVQIPVSGILPKVENSLTDPSATQKINGYGWYFTLNSIDSNVSLQLVVHFVLPNGQVASSKPITLAPFLGATKEQIGTVVEQVVSQVSNGVNGDGVSTIVGSAPFITSAKYLSDQISVIGQKTLTDTPNWSREQGLGVNTSVDSIFNYLRNMFGTPAAPGILGSNKVEVRTKDKTTTLGNIELLPATRDVSTGEISSPEKLVFTINDTARLLSNPEFFDSAIDSNRPKTFAWDDASLQDTGTDAFGVTNYIASILLNALNMRTIINQSFDSTGQTIGSALGNAINNVKIILSKNLDASNIIDLSFSAELFQTQVNEQGEHTPIIASKTVNIKGFSDLTVETVDNLLTQIGQPDFVEQTYENEAAFNTLLDKSTFFNNAHALLKQNLDSTPGTGSDVKLYGVYAFIDALGNYYYPMSADASLSNPAALAREEAINKFINANLQSLLSKSIVTKSSQGTALTKVDVQTATATGYQSGLKESGKFVNTVQYTDAALYEKQSILQLLAISGIRSINVLPSKNTQDGKVVDENNLTTGLSYDIVITFSNGKTLVKIIKITF